MTTEKNIQPKKVQDQLEIPRIKVAHAGGSEIIQIAPEGYEQLKCILASHSGKFVDEILHNLRNGAMASVNDDATAITTGLAMVAAIKPQDELETLLAVQMTAVHMATMQQARRLAKASTIPGIDSAERAMNKLARTFTTQIETLKRYRSGGEQRVTVQHVHVNEGGQAVVGHVEQKIDQG